MEKKNFLSFLLRATILTFCFSFFLSLLPLQSASAKEGYAWWNRDDITASGYGVKSENKSDSSKKCRKNIKDLTIKKAKESLVEKIAGIGVRVGETIDADMAKSVAELSSVIKEQTDAKGSIKVSVGLPVYGEKSLLQAVLMPYEKEKLPALNNDKYEPQGNYDLLVIDCTQWEDENKTFLNPVLLPEIKDEDGGIVYGYRNLERDTLVKWGAVFYAPNLKSTAANALVIRVKYLADESATPVISSEDAEKIIMENNRAHFLDKAAVVIISRRVDAVVKYNRDNRGGRSWGIRDSDVYS